MTGKCSDINQGLTSTITSMMDLSWTVDLTPWIEKEENAVKKDDFYEPMLRSCTADGKLMAVPLQTPICFFTTMRMR